MSVDERGQGTAIYVGKAKTDFKDIAIYIGKAKVDYQDAESTRATTNGARISKPSL